MNLGLSYVPEHLPRHLEDDLCEMKEIGCDEVIFALQEQNFTVVNGALRYGAKLAVKNGLRPYVDVWGFANTFGGGYSANFMLLNTDVWQIDAGGKKVPTACLNNPHLAAEFGRLVGICRDQGFQGVIIDEPVRQNCFCSWCRRKFSCYSKKQMEETTKTKEYQTFQIATIGNYVRTVVDMVKRIDKSLQTMACLYPDERDCWKAVSPIKNLDVFGTDPYWLLPTPGETITLEDAVNYTRDLLRVCRDNHKKSQVWLNCWNVPAGLEKEIYHGGKKLAEVGCDSFYAWSFRGGLGTYEECADSSKCWKYLSKLYRELKHFSS